MTLISQNEDIILMHADFESGYCATCRRQPGYGRDMVQKKDNEKDWIN